MADQPQKSKEQEEIETRARLFDKEFQDLQNKYKMKAIAQIVFPTGEGTPPAVMNVPIILIPFQVVPQAQSKPEEKLANPTA